MWFGSTRQKCNKIKAELRWSRCTSFTPLINSSWIKVTVPVDKTLFTVTHINLWKTFLSSYCKQISYCFCWNHPWAHVIKLYKYGGSFCLSAVYKFSELSRQISARHSICAEHGYRPRTRMQTSQMGLLQCLKFF